MSIGLGVGYLPQERFPKEVVSLGLGGGYFLADNLEIGLGLSRATNENKDQAYGLSSSFTGYIPLAETLYLPLSVGVGKTLISKPKSDSETAYAFGAGLLLQIEELIGINLGVSFGTAGGFRAKAFASYGIGAQVFLRPKTIK